MSNFKIITSAVSVLTAVVILFSGMAYGQDFGNPIPGTGNGRGTVGRFNQNERAIDTLVGIAIGGFIGYMIGNSQAQNHNNYYDRDQDHNRYRDDRYYNTNTRRHHRNGAPEYDAHYDYRHAPWDR